MKWIKEERGGDGRNTNVRKKRQCENHDYVEPQGSYQKKPFLWTSCLKKAHLIDQLENL